MNLPFPALTPRLTDYIWFRADSPCDEEAEQAALEKAYQHWMNSIGQKYTKITPLGMKSDPEPMDKADNDQEEVNDESVESEEPHHEDDGEDEEDVPTSFTTVRNNDELEPESLDDLNEDLDLQNL